MVSGNASCCRILTGVLGWKMQRALLLAAGGRVFWGLLFWWNHSGNSQANQPALFPGPSSGTENDKASSSFTPSVATSSTAAMPRYSGNDQVLYDPIVVAPCHLAPVQEQEVSSQVDGVFAEILAGLGQQVSKGEILGRLDDRQVRAQVDLLEIKATSKAAELIAKAQYDEANSKVQFAIRANQSGLNSVPELEYKGYLFQRERFAQEVKKAQEDRQEARKELEKTLVQLRLHKIASGLKGEIVKVYKQPGEAVKQAEPLFRVADYNRLRIEGLCKVHQADLLRVGMRALLEPEIRGEQLTELSGHTGAVTSLAVLESGQLLASSSEDRTVILWQWPQGKRQALLSHPAEVNALAWSPISTARNGAWLLSGCTDGQGRLWWISSAGHGETPLPLELTHEGPIRCVAFDRTGTLCATGGDDKRIGIWEVASRKHLYWLSPEDGPAHNGAITSLNFTPDGRLVSAGRDNTLKVWSLTSSGGKLIGLRPGRTGEVTQLGISPDGNELLFDHGEELRILDSKDFANRGTIWSRRQGRFHGLAQYSPTGRLILASANNGRLQLWKVPASPATIAFFRHGYAHGLDRATLLNLVPSPAGLASPGNAATPRLWSLHGFEVRHYLAPGVSVTQSAAFAPDERVFFSVGSDKLIRAWAIPAPEHWQQPLEAQITFVGSQLERGTYMVRIRAEMDNPQEPSRRLRSGTQAILRLYPETKPSP